MANITGTNGNDRLTGTTVDDTIQGLEGNDRIIGSLGIDTVDGGAGNDALDFNNIGKNLFLSYTGGFAADVDLVIGDPTNATISTGISNVETVIGDPNKSNTINDFSRFPIATGNVDVNLSTGRVTYGTKNYSVKNFDNIRLSNSSGRFLGNDRDNTIFVGFGGILPPGTTSTIIASKGNDRLFAETIDYGKIGNAINVLAKLVYSPGSGREPFESVKSEIAVEKGGFGKDAIGAGKIIGAVNKSNTLDVSSSDRTSVIINLSTNLLSGSEGSKDPSTAKVLFTKEIVNFANAVGTNRNDIIVGANKKGKLTGGGGSDTITGGNKNDILTGSDSIARGVGEVDTLTGGGGRDKFVLGDANGAYYIGKGKDDYATITDFNLFQDSIDLGGFKNYSFASGANNSIELYSGKDVNTRDLIAKIQLTGGISNRSTNSRSVMGADASLNAITSNLNILSTASDADA